MPGKVENGIQADEGGDAAMHAEAVEREQAHGEAIEQEQAHEIRIEQEAPQAEKKMSVPPSQGRRSRFGRFKNVSASAGKAESSLTSHLEIKNETSKPPRWSMGILNDRDTEEVPGSVLLMARESNQNQPLGLQIAPARTSASTLPSPYLHLHEEKKKTADGGIILEPQPDDSANDPLNWPSWRRDAALLSLGLYCMVGGGMTPVLAAGFTNVAADYHISTSRVALTTGLYMMGLGLGSVLASPTAILYGKRPVYLITSLLFIVSSVWCAVSPNFASLIVARIVQGLAVSPVECLPSATIAEIFFLHERAYRLGIYTLLLLGGKNIVPLVSAAIVQKWSWRWVFGIVAMVVTFCSILLFFFVPETFWDRTPRPSHNRSKRPSLASLSALFHPVSHGKSKPRPIAQDGAGDDQAVSNGANDMRFTNIASGTIAKRRQQRKGHVDFASQPTVIHIPSPSPQDASHEQALETIDSHVQKATEEQPTATSTSDASANDTSAPLPGAFHSDSWRVVPRGGAPTTPGLHNLNSPYYLSKITPNDGIDYLNARDNEAPHPVAPAMAPPVTTAPPTATSSAMPSGSIYTGPLPYTHHLLHAPAKSFVQTLRPWNGRLRKDVWFKVAIRPFILFAYPSILWSTLVYSLSVGWLIVLSESVAAIYRDASSYNFGALATGLVYLSPFIGGILGTAIAGRASDVLVRFMARRNDGIYEPEFRLIMAIPVAIATCIGLMGFGWSAQERDNFMVPTAFFGVISFGCSLGSTTAITFAVDSYRQYAGEALVTMNFSKNIFHGLVFSLFFPEWLAAKGPRDVFLALGCIQLACLVSTIPMYIYGKRARMWTVRKNMMERL